MIPDLKDHLMRLVQILTSASKQTYAAIGFGLLVALLYFGIFFRRPGSFKEDVDNVGKIPILDRDYDYVDDEWSKLKIMIWIGLSVGAGFVAYYQLPHWFPGFFR